MSRDLESLLGAERRAECARNDTPLSAWQRQFAKSFAAAVPLTPSVPIRARGNHLAASNDEPEPGADRLQFVVDQVHLLRSESQPNSERFKALSEVLEVLRAARSE